MNMSGYLGEQALKIVSTGLSAWQNLTFGRTGYGVYATDTGGKDSINGVYFLHSGVSTGTGPYGYAGYFGWQEDTTQTYGRTNPVFYIYRNSVSNHTGTRNESFAVGSFQRYSYLSGG